MMTQGALLSSILSVISRRKRLPDDSSPYVELLKQFHIPEIEQNVIKEVRGSQVVDGKIFSMFAYNGHYVHQLLEADEITEGYTKIFAIPAILASALGFITTDDIQETDIVNITSALAIVNFPDIWMGVHWLYLQCIKHFLEVGSTVLTCKSIETITANVRKLDTDTLEIATFLLMNQNHNYDVSIPIFDLIRRTVDSLVEENVDFNDKPLIDALEPFIEEHLDVLNCIEALAKNTSSPNVSKLYAKIPPIIIKMSKDIPQKDIEFHGKEDIKYFEYDITELSYPDTKIDNNPGALVLDPIDKKKKITTGVFLHDEWKEKIRTTMHLFNEINDAHLYSFFDSYAKLIDSSVTGYATFLYYVNHVKFDINVPLSQSVFESLLFKPLFEPTATYLSVKENFDVTSFYRDRVMAVTVCHCVEFIPKLLEKFVRFPFLFTEIVARLRRQFPTDVVPKELRTEDSLNVILKVDIELAQIYERDDSDKEMVMKSRATVCGFFFDVFKDPISEQVHLDLLLNSIQNEFFCNTMIDNIKNKTSATAFVQNVFSVLKYVETPDSVFTMLIDLTCDTVNQSPQTISGVITSLIEFLKMNSNEDRISQLLCLFNKLNAKFSCSTWGRSVLPLVNELLTESSYKGSSDSIFRLLTRSTEEDVFIIDNPMILLLIISFCSSYSSTDKIFERFIKLCDYSSANISQMFDGEIDILIIDMIDHFPNDFTFRGFKITNFKDREKLLDGPVTLFTKIAVNMSSEVVAERITKLLQPRSDDSFTSLVWDFMDRILPLTSQLSDNLALAHPLGIQKPLYVIENALTCLSIGKGITVTAWIYLDEFLANGLDIQSSVFSLASQEDLLEVYIRGTSIYCCIANSKTKITVKLLDKFLTSQWTLLTVSIKRGVGKTMKITVWMNNEVHHTVDMAIKSFKNEDAPVKCIAGNTREHTIDRLKLSSIYQLAQMGCYDFILSSENVTQLVSSHGRVEEPLVPLFLYPKYANVNAKLPVRPIKEHQRGLWCIPNICEIFTDYYPIEKILPLFRLGQDSYSEKHSLLLIRSLAGLYGSSTTKVFTVIPEFLINSEMVLTADHYSGFCEWLEICQTDKDKISLCNSILCNFRLWAKSEEKDLERIMNMILNKYFTSLQPYLLSIDFFTNVMSSVRGTMYISETQHDDILCHRNNTTDVLKLLDIFKQILVERCKLQITADEMDCLLASILYCKDPLLMEYMMELLPELVRLRIALKRHITILMSFDVNNNPRIFHSMILALRGMTSKLYECSVELCPRINPDVEIPTLFTDFMNSPMIFPLVYMLAARYDTEKQLELVDIMNSMADRPTIVKSILTLDFWVLWPLVFALRVKDENVREKVCDWVTRISLTESGSAVLEASLVLKVLEATTVLDTHKIIIRLVSNLMSRISITPGFMKFIFILMYVKAFCSSHETALIREFSHSLYNTEDIDFTPKISDLDSIDSIRNAFLLNDIQFYTVIPETSPEMIQITQKMTGMTKPTGVLAKVMDTCIHYSRGDMDSSYVLIKRLNKYASKIHPLLKDIRNATITFSKSLVEFLSFEVPDEPVVDDPMIEFKKNIAKASDAAETRQRFIMKKFEHRTGKCKYRRDFTFSPEFESILLKPYTQTDTNPKRTANPPKGQHIMYPCKRIRVHDTQKCRMYIQNQRVVFVYRDHRKVYRKSDIRHIMARTRFNQHTAVEFFFTDGTAVLLDFAPLTSDSILEHFDKRDCKNLIILEKSDFRSFIEESGLVKKWASGKIGNFNFIMKLNMYSGRSMQDTTNGVIFPFVFLKKRRNFSLPTPAQNEERVQHFMELLENNGYSFGTAPMNSMLLSYYFPRIEPYTTLHEKIHDGKTDTRERMFTNWTDFINNLVSGEECKEAVSEFYSFPEMFRDLNDTGLGDLEVNKTIFEFVYENRKRLESETTSRTLNNWIDMIWGVNQKHNVNTFIPYIYPDAWENSEYPSEVLTTVNESLGSYPPCVFTESIPHWKKARPTITLKQAVKIKIQKVKDIERAFIFEKENIRLILCFKDGTIQRYTVRCERNGWNTQSVYLAPLKLKLQKDASFCVCDASVFVFDSNTDKLYNIGFEQMRQFACDTSVNFAFQGMNPGEVITGNRTGLIQRMSSPDYVPERLFSIVSEIIIASDFSSKHGVFICATADGYLRFYSSRRGSENKAVKIDCLPEKVMATHGFGFVIVYAPKQLLLFTINGSFIKKASIPCEIVEWNQWESTGGFDHVCLTDMVGNIYTFEAFYPEKVRQVASLNETIIGVGYSKTTNAIVAVGSEPHVHVIPI